MLAVDAVSVAFDGIVALDSVSLSVGDGETVAVLGPSGCGKTTLLRVIGGLQRSDMGRVSWDGVDLDGVPPHERRFGLVFQEYALFPHRDVKGNVEFGLRMAGRDANERARRVAEVLALVGLGDLADRRVAGLSGGEQQRVALARALAVSPRLLMLDEPLGALDRAWRARLLEEMRVLLDREHLSAIYVTHDQAEAFGIASRIVLMRAGRVVQDATPAELWRAPIDAAVAEFLGFGAAVPARSAGGRVETPWGSFAAAPGAPTGPVDVVLRPDALQIAPHGSLIATVRRATIDGGAVRLELQSATGPRLTTTVSHRDIPRVGDEIRLEVAEDALLVYPRTAD